MSKIVAWILHTACRLWRRGDDTLVGNDFGSAVTGGTHTLFGEAGQRHVLCRFVGLVGNATMDGGTGNDSFFGGRGSDFMFGAGSADTFVFHAADLMLVTRTLQRALGLAK